MELHDNVSYLAGAANIQILVNIILHNGSGWIRTPYQDPKHAECRIRIEFTIEEILQF